MLTRSRTRVIASAEHLRAAHGVGRRLAGRALSSVSSGGRRCSLVRYRVKAYRPSSAPSATASASAASAAGSASAICRALPGQRPDRRAGGAAQRLGIGLAAEADRDDQGRRQRAAGGDLGDLVLRSGGAEHGQGGGQAAAERRVHVLRAGRQHRPVAALGDPDDHRVSLGVTRRLPVLSARP